MTGQLAWRVGACSLILAATILVAFSTNGALAQEATPPEDAPAAAESHAKVQSEKSDNESGNDQSDRVQLQFRDQSWPDVLEWLAEQSNLNLDWQAMPEGTLNLSSSSSYKLEEAHDMINMQLMARGFTLLARGEVLRLVPLAQLDPTLVERVEPEELTTLSPHQFVRVSFPLEWIVAEEAVKEFEPLLSPYGKLHAMGQTNRLEAIDAVVNLRELRRLLTEADKDEVRRDRVVEFVLEHRRAEDVAPKVRQLLGLPPQPTTAATGTALDIEKTRFRNEAVKALGAGAEGLLEDKPEVQLVVNEEENSILVHARADKIEVARQAIEAIDKPLPPQESPWESANRVKTYMVEGFDATTVTSLVKSMQQAGKLAEETRVEHEPTYNRLVVYASPDDQLAIASLIRNFQTEQRAAKVIDLGSLDPNYAVNAVTTILKNPARPDKIPGAASNGSFQIEADTANRRLLLWATSEEATEVETFLTQLGKSTAGVEPSKTTYVLHTKGTSVSDLESRIQEVWTEVSDAPLVIESVTKPKPKPKPDEQPETETPVSGSVPEPKETRAPRAITGRLVAQTQPAPTAHPAADPVADPATELETESDAEETTDAPVRIIEGANDQLIIVSKDARAAALARALVEGLLPKYANIRLVELEHASASEVRTQLMTMLDRKAVEQVSSLSPPPPKYAIDVDARTNSLILESLTPEQLHLVEQMVEVLDKPAPKDEESQRVQKIYKAQNVRAGQLAEDIKEVYRDLLSKVDSAFASSNRGVEKPLLGYTGNPADDTKTPQYQGVLSVATQEATNSVVISAPKYLIDEVMELASQLDKRPANSSVGFVQLAPGSHPEDVVKALKAVLGQDDK